MNRIFKKRAFTLVELIIATAILAVVMTSIITVLVNFMRNYGKSESSGILLQESALFLASLRNDLNNAVLEGDNINTNLNNIIVISNDNILRIPVYNNASGKVEQVFYEIEETKSGYNILRRVNNNNVKRIASNIATITWKLEHDSFIAKPKNIIRYNILLDAEFNNNKEKSGSSLKLKTAVFPARLNRQIN